MDVASGLHARLESFPAVKTAAEKHGRTLHNLRHPTREFGTGRGEKRTGKRVFLMAPIHHHFEKKGWAEPQVVIRFWIISLILALIGLATLKIR